MAKDDRGRSGGDKYVIHLETEHLVIRDHIPEDLQHLQRPLGTVRMTRLLPLANRRTFSGGL